MPQKPPAKPSNHSNMKPTIKKGKDRPTMPRTKLKRRAPKSTTLHLAVKDLTPHPLLDRVGMLPDLIERETKKGKAQGKNRDDHKENAEQLSREFAAVEASVVKHGIREKLKVVKNPAGGWWIADGRHRWTIATRNGFQTVPCEEIREDEVVAVIMDGVQRRHLSKSGRAYLAVLMHPEIATVENRGGDRSKTAKTAVLITQASLAEQAGVSETFIRYAVDIFRKFEKRKAWREKYEPGIWCGNGLDKTLAAIAAEESTGKDDDAPESEEEAARRIYHNLANRVLKGWTSITTSLKSWDKLEPEDKKQFIRNAADTILEAPEEFRIALAAEWLGKPKH